MELHHVNLIASRGESKDFVFNILEKELNFKTNANPDFLLIEKESFGIPDARSFEKWIVSKPLVGEIKVCAIFSNSITHEAQNALLKALEEPPLGTYIFINLESLGGILPTLLSRVRVLKTEEGEIENNPNAKKFLEGKIKDRLALIRNLSKKEDKGELKEILKDLEMIAYKDDGKKDALNQILKAKIYAASRGSSPKMLLEWLASVI